MSTATLNLAELIGTPYVEGGRDVARDKGLDCWGVTRAGLARIGIEAPEEMGAAVEFLAARAELLSDKRIPQAGDLIVLSGPINERGYMGVPRPEDGGRHVGICIDGWRFVHAVRGVNASVASVAYYRRCDPNCRVYRIHKETLAAATNLAPVRMPAPGKPIRLRMAMLTDLIGKRARWTGNARFEKGCTAADAAAFVCGASCSTMYGDGAAWVVLVNGMPIARELAGDWHLGDDDELAVVPAPGDPVTWVLVGIALVSAAASAFILSGLAPKAAGNTDSEQRRFGFSRYSQSAIAGEPMQVVLGRIVRYGGLEVVRAPGDGPDGGSRIKILTSMGRGA
ncbi:MAG: NlpC/P60 family protein, partial [Acidimicrobiales bacterium]